MTKQLRPKRSSPRRFDAGFLITTLANTADSGIIRFRNFYAKDGLYQRPRYSDERLLRLRDELRLVWEADADPTKSPDLELFRMGLDGPHACALQHMINETSGKFPVQTAIYNLWLRREKQPFAVVWAKQKPEIKAVRECLPAVLAWSCVYYSGNLKVCGNKDCDCPYFISKRKDQRYCSDVCAAPAKRAAKRKWWNENRGRVAVAK